MTLRFKHIHEFGGLVIFKIQDKQSRQSFSLLGTHSREHWPGEGTDDTRGPRTGKTGPTGRSRSTGQQRPAAVLGGGNSVIPLRAREDVGS